MPLLVLYHVAVGYKNSPDILHDVSLTLEPSEQLAIVGSNGEGKTTLLKVAAGLLTPTSGERKYIGTSSPALLFQSPRQQLICATVQEEIEYTLRLNAIDEDEIETRTQFLLKQFGLHDLASSAPRNLSGGQQQRLALAALLCRQPELLLLDEPDAFLDGRARQDFREYFSEHVKSAVIWVVSRVSEIPKDMRILRLECGTLVETFVR